MAKVIKQEMNLVKLVAQFSNEDKARKFLESVRWPEGVQCPRCAHEGVSKIQKRNQYDCNKCRYQFSVTSGTIFHDTHLPLTKWFMATYLMLESKKGISANQLMRTIGVSYRTAWYLCHRIRKAMTGAYPFPLKGVVEIDETWHGGEARGRGKGFVGNKAVIVGAYQRGGKIILKVVKGRSRADLLPFVEDVVHKDAEAIFTDEWISYRGLGNKYARHETVNHKAKEYVRGDVSTNSIENVWSLFKRSVVGTFHHMSIKHLQAYLEELEWRFNNRDNPWLFRDTVQRLIVSGNVEYKELTA